MFEDGCENVELIGNLGGFGSIIFDFDGCKLGEALGFFALAESKHAAIDFSEASLAN